MSNSDKILGVVVLARHGDRQGFYQDPITYNPSNTAITPLGNVQEFQLGQKLRSIYFNSSSPSFISGINTTVADETQLHVRADGGGERGVIFNSAVSVLQGLFPATQAYNTTLANGTTVIGPLGGYQYVPIESVEPDNDISLEGWTSCGEFTNSNIAFYSSPAFKQKEADHADFLKSLTPYVGGRNVSLQNMWNIYDFMNVESIHDAKFQQALPLTFLEQARDLANWHEYGIFSSPQLDGIGNIAGQAILPSILEGFASITNSSDPIKFVYEAIAYKPFLSLFNMTGVAQQNPELASIVNYAAVLALEVRQPASGGPVIRFNFKNGTDANGTDSDFKTYNFLGESGDVPLSTFVSTLSTHALQGLPAWCTVCQNQQDRGCGDLAAAKLLGMQAAESQSHRSVSPVAAGFIGAAVTLVFLAIVLFFLSLLGLFTFNKRSTKARKTNSKAGSDINSLEYKA
ncbi:histidine phosphatase superfamily [Crucibulum laeve]|uniref:Histidine phosphatase superfamily n=1 Tax=Crucibulum laeve TaxID=68775 RepID=A0A5C3MHS0_9AGAR|nr:histidine phosphatase superfamily [Crucibulum laeve]